MTADVRELPRGELAAAAALLARACVFERAGEVAEEKLFGAAPRCATIDGRFVEHGPPHVPRAIGAWRGGELVGIAAVASDRIRVLAVAPEHRGGGIGTALLDACVAAIREPVTATRVRTLDQPGNYLAPGIDARDAATLGWLARRGFTQLGEPRANVRVAVRDNPRVSVERREDAAARARASGYEVRRARPDEDALLAAVHAEFGGAWPFEIARALGRPSPSEAPASPAASGVHVALKDGAYCAFAAHDGNNRGLGWFGPTGTWPAHRGQGLGEALLLACLVDVGEKHDTCEVAWIGPRPFYDKVAGIAEDRSFIVMARAL